jgi:hypothetical protein
VGEFWGAAECAPVGDGGAVRDLCGFGVGGGGGDLGMDSAADANVASAGDGGVGVVFSWDGVGGERGFGVAAGEGAAAGGGRGNSEFRRHNSEHFGCRD